MTAGLVACLALRVDRCVFRNGRVPGEDSPVLTISTDRSDERWIHHFLKNLFGDMQVHYDINLCWRSAVQFDRRAGVVHWPRRFDDGDDDQ